MNTRPSAAATGVVEGYEALRSVATGGDGSSAPPRGLAVLLRSGLPTWIATWTTVAWASMSGARATPTTAIPALGTRADIATVLATMALAACRG